MAFTILTQLWLTFYSYILLSIRGTKCMNTKYQKKEGPDVKEPELGLSIHILLKYS